MRALLALLLAFPLAAAKPLAPPVMDAIRFYHDPVEGDRLQVGLHHFLNDAGHTVDLIGAVHLADRAFYEDLNRRFSNYDAVLYELVGDPAPFLAAMKTRRAQTAEERKAEESAAPALRKMQLAMGRMLQLEHQMEVVDYTPAHFVHADLTWEQFSVRREAKDENLLTLANRMWKNAGKGGGLDPFMMAGLLGGEESAAELKRTLAEQFAHLDVALTDPAGPDGSVLLGERNQRALDVLREQMTTGRRRFALFYGAAHLPDLAQRLTTGLGFQESHTVWLDAWTLEVPVKAKKK